MQVVVVIIRVRGRRRGGGGDEAFCCFSGRRQSPFSKVSSSNLRGTLSGEFKV